MNIVISSISILISLIALCLSIWNFVVDYREKRFKLTVCLAEMALHLDDTKKHRFTFRISNESRHPISITDAYIVVSNGNEYRVDRKRNTEFFPINIGGYGAQDLVMPIEVEETTDFAVKSVFKLHMATSRGSCVAQLVVGPLSSFK